MSDRDLCPVCEHPYNHETDHGMRLQWPREVKYQICTPEDSNHVFVHTKADPDDDYWDDDIEDFLNNREADQ